jgi:hypothetical protein
MGKVVRFQVSPDDFDVIQLRSVFGQPFDGEPVVAFGQRHAGGLADVDETVVEDNADEIVAEIVAKRLVEHLERARFVVMKRPAEIGAAALTRGFEG